MDNPCDGEGRHQDDGRHCPRRCKRQCAPQRVELCLQIFSEAQHVAKYKRKRVRKLPVSCFSALDSQAWRWHQTVFEQKLGKRHAMKTFLLRFFTWWNGQT